MHPFLRVDHFDNAIRLLNSCTSGYFKIPNKRLQWNKFFLKHKVFFKDCNSTCKQINYGDLQRSNLGLVLFTIYVNDILKKIASAPVLFNTHQYTLPSCFLFLMNLCTQCLLIFGTYQWERVASYCWSFSTPNLLIWFGGTTQQLN